MAKLTKEEVEELDALKRIRRVKHRPFSVDDADGNALAGVFSCELAEEIDEVGGVGLPAFEDEMDSFSDDLDSMSDDNNPDLIRSASLPIYVDGESASGDIFPYGVKAPGKGRITPSKEILQRIHMLCC